MPKEKKNPGFVTRTECEQISASIRHDLLVVKDALVGKDLRGGLVKDVGELKMQMQELRNSREASQKWKLATVGFAATILGVILKYLLGG